MVARKSVLKEYAPLIKATLISMSIVAASWGFTIKLAETFVDRRIDKKMDYTVILLQKIATPEQKKAADEEYDRKWKGNKE